MGIFCQITEPGLFMDHASIVASQPVGLFVAATKVACGSFGCRARTEVLPVIIVLLLYTTHDVLYRNATLFSPLVLLLELLNPLRVIHLGVVDQIRLQLVQ